MSLKTKIRSLKLKTTKCLWVDINYKGWKAEDISDDYLKHIIYFISEGKGWHDFIHNKERINKIFNEAYKRHICRADVLLILHQGTLYIHGYDYNCPKYWVTWDGEYY